MTCNDGIPGETTRGQTGAFLTPPSFYHQPSFYERHLSPALSPIPNGGEGEHHASARLGAKQRPTSRGQCQDAPHPPAVNNPALYRRRGWRIIRRQ